MSSTPVIPQRVTRCPLHPSEKLHHQQQAQYTEITDLRSNQSSSIIVHLVQLQMELLARFQSPSQGMRTRHSTGQA